MRASVRSHRTQPRHDNDVLKAPSRRLARRRAAVLAASLAALALGACAGGAPAQPSHHQPPAHQADAPCGAQAQATIAAADAAVTEHIYDNELAGREINTDIAHVTSATDLVKAVDADDVVAAHAAVLRLIFHPGWHIVRLQVFNRAGKLLSDIGGTWTIAPVAGVLKSGSRRVGRFLMSVQDDTGETKLETRFVGNPVGIYVDGILVAQRYGAFPAALPKATSMTLSHRRYAIVSQTFNAFPSGTLVEIMLVAAPKPSLALMPCPALRAAEFGRVAERLAALATDLPRQFSAYAVTVAMFSGIDVFVRNGRRLLGTSGGAGPAKPPDSGTVDYQGRTWLVYSFEPLAVSGARVYLLIPPA
jgi:hypothetical protein